MPNGDAPLDSRDRLARRLAQMQEDANLRPLTPPLPPPSAIEFDGHQFVDTPERHNMTLGVYVATLLSIRQNMRLFMRRRFGADGGGDRGGGNFCDAPHLLSNYLTVESLVRGFATLPRSVHLHLLEDVLGEWGFHFNGTYFSLPRQEAMSKILSAQGYSVSQFVNLVEDPTIFRPFGRDEPSKASDPETQTWPAASSGLGLSGGPVESTMLNLDGSRRQREVGHAERPGNDA